MTDTQKQELVQQDNNPSKASTMSDYVLQQIVAVTSDLPDDHKRKRHYIQQMIEDIDPRDMVEAMMISQMIVSHETALSCIKRANAQEVSDVVRQSELRMAAHYSKLLTDHLKTFYLYRGQSLEWEISSERHKQSVAFDKILSGLK